jgi:hypothetical protein
MKSSEAGKRRQGKSRRQRKEAVVPVGQSASRPDEIVPVIARVVRLQAGLGIAEINAAPSSDGHDSAPVWVGQLPSAADNIDLLAAQGRGEQWLPGGDNLVVVRSSQPGALLLATAFGSPGQQPSAPKAAVCALEAPGMTAYRPSDVVPAEPPLTERPLSRRQREIRAEVTVHLEGVGDRVFPGAAWAGKPGERKRIEGFAIRPLQELRPNEIEYKVLHPGGVETQWVSGPQFCGTRGRSLPIVGFAVRIAPHVQDQFSVVYQAAFFRGGITEPRSNGAPCMPAITGDALEGINIRVLQSQPG